MIYKEICRKNFRHTKRRLRFMKKITGSIVALVTPFNQDGSTDFVRLR